MALPALQGLNVNAILGQFDAGRKQRQEQNQLNALTQAAQTLQQGGDLRAVAPQLLQSGNVGGFSALMSLANQNRAAQQRQDQFSDTQAFREKQFTQNQANVDRTFGAGRSDTAFNQNLARQKLGLARTAAQTAGQQPKSPLGKLASDFRKGLISRETFIAGRKKLATHPAGVTVNNAPATSKGTIKQDQDFAVEANKWRLGGSADAVKMTTQLRDALGTLQSGANVTGSIIGNTPDALLSIFKPGAVATREAVEEVVQRNLRLILGAQFTQKEGAQLIARAFNPRLGEEENARRVSRLLAQMRHSIQAKQSAVEYFEQNGTLRGWSGKMPRISDFDNIAGGGQQNQPTTGRTPSGLNFTVE